MVREPTYDELKHALIICLEGGIGAFYCGRMVMYETEERNVSRSKALQLTVDHERKIISVYETIPAAEGMGS